MTDIDPILTFEDKEIFPFVPFPVPKPNSRLLLVGSSNTGKTTFCANLLTKFWVSPETNKSVFDVTLICTVWMIFSS